MKPKLFRDPVHDIISFDLLDDVEAVLFELIQTRSFQRLRRVRQLGFANLIYHGAEHSRFVHSLGVVHVAGRMFDSIREEAGLTDEDRLEVLCAAVLHDIGHGPFSHAIEKVTGVPHEAYTRAIIDDPTSDVSEVLGRHASDLADRVGRYFGSRDDFPPERQVLLDIVSSQLDADRLDYILRDGMSTGVKIGVYDFERIQAMFRTYRGSSDGSSTLRLAVSYRAREAVEGYLIARFHMFKQVYLHKAVRSAEKMLEATLRRARQLLEDDYEFAIPLDATVGRLLSGEELSAEEFTSLDDTDVWVALKKWRHDPDSVLSMLSAGLLDRQLYKTIALDPNDPVAIARSVDRARELARDAGYDPDYAVLLDRAQDTPYRPYDPSTSAAAAHIPIIERDGSATPIEDISDLVHLLGRDAYKIIHLCVPGEVREQLVEFLAASSPV